MADRPKPRSMNVPVNISMVSKKIPRTIQCHQSKCVDKNSIISFPYEIIICLKLLYSFLNKIG
jgi:hypothetical protein